MKARSGALGPTTPAMAVPSWATLVAVICLGLPHGVVMGKSDVEKKLLDIDPSNFNDPTNIDDKFGSSGHRATRFPDM